MELRVLGSHQEGERPYTYFFATSQEVREGVGIARFTGPGFGSGMVPRLPEFE